LPKSVAGVNYRKVYRLQISSETCDFDSPVDRLYKKWLVNLSDVSLFDEVCFLLHLGEKFGLPFNKSDRLGMLVEFIKNIENNILKHSDNVRNIIRNQTVL